jgi:hypothetical protein
MHNYNKIYTRTHKQQPYSDIGRLTVQFCISHTDTPHSVALLWTRNRPVAETSAYTTHNIHMTKTSMSPAGFESAIPTSKRPQTHALQSSFQANVVLTVTHWLLRVNIQRSGFPLRHHCQGYNLSRDSTTVVIRTPRLTSLLLWVTKCALYVTEGSTVSRLYNTEFRFRLKKFPSAVLIDRYKTGFYFLNFSRQFTFLRLCSYPVMAFSIKLF